MLRSIISTAPRPFLTSCLSQTAKRTTLSIRNTRQFSSTPTKSAEPLTASEVNSKVDPSVAKQFDATTPISEQINDFYSFVDANRISLMTTLRHNPNTNTTTNDNGEGLPTTRAMAVSKRIGPDILYLANIHSSKIKDLQTNSGKCSISFFNTSSYSWCSISGHATITQRDPRISEIYSPVVSAWFGDLGDGIHTGHADDPRMALIEVKAERVSYYLSTKGKVARMVDMAKAVGLGEVAQTGVLREISGDALEGARSKK